MTNSISPEYRSNLEPNNIDQPYLQLQLGTETLAVIPMQNTQEVLTVASRRIAVMPNMPHCILGLINQRSRVIWVVDLSQMLGKQGIDRNLQQYQLVIIRVKNLPLGLVVPRIIGVTRLSVEAIQSPLGNVASGLVPYLQGCCWQTDRVLLVLDAEAIINSPLLQF